MIGKIEEMKLISQCVLFDNRDAFGKLVDAYQPEMRRFFLNLTLGDVPLSEDLAQDTFVKAFLNIRSFKGLARFRTWLYKIGYNIFYEYRRREMPVSDLESPPDIDSVNTAGGVEASLDIKTAFATLSPAKRSVATMFFINDLPIKEIADATGMPQGTVKSHISRARTKLETVLKDKYL